MKEIQGKSIFVRVSEVSSYRESTVFWKFKLQSNPVSTDTEGPKSVRNNEVSVLRGSSLEKM